MIYTTTDHDTFLRACADPRSTDDMDTTKTLTIGQDYGVICGAPEGCKMIYLGDNTWRAVRRDGTSKDVVSTAQTDMVIDYVNRPVIHMGQM